MTVHRLVQAVTRDALDEATAKACAEAAVRLVDAALPRPPQEPTTGPRSATLLPHALAAAEAAERLGVGLETRRDGAERGGALPRRRAPPTPRPSRSTSAPSRSARRRSGRTTPTSPPRSTTSPRCTRPPAATPRPSRSSSARSRSARRRSGRTTPTSPSALNNLAVLYQGTGRYAEAEPLFERALAIREKALGPDHPDVATRLNNLAVLYRDTGRHAEAEPLYQRALAIREKALGPDHPDIATAQQPRRALPGHRPPRRGRAALRARDRDPREGPPRRPPELGDRPQEPRHPPRGA